MRGKAINTKKATKLPPAMAALRPRWGIWRPIQIKGRIQKLTYVVKDPRRVAKPTDLQDWDDLDTALAAVEAGEGVGVSYLLREDDNIAAIDLDDCVDPDTGSIAPWAQQFLERAKNTHVEFSPGNGVHVWGFTADNTARMHSNTLIDIDGKQARVELFRRTNKVLTVTGDTIGRSTKLANIDGVLDWGQAFAQRHKAATAKPTQEKKGDGALNGGAGHDSGEIMRIIREGAPEGGDRSAWVHSCVGHLRGIGWGVERITDYFLEYPEGLGDKFNGQGRLDREIARSFDKFEPQLAPQIEALKRGKAK